VQKETCGQFSVVVGPCAGMMPSQRCFRDSTPNQTCDDMSAGTYFSPYDLCNQALSLFKSLIQPSYMQHIFFSLALC
jgi:hypothetical protein